MKDTEAAKLAGVEKHIGVMLLPGSLKAGPSGSSKVPISGVSTPPGATTFTRTPRDRYSAARAFENIRSPALEAQYAAEYDWPMRAVLEATLTMDPPWSRRWEGWPGRPGT